MYTVSHDDGDLTVHLEFTEPETALRIDRGEETVIEPSPIGLPTPSGQFPGEYEFVEERTEIVEESFATPHGKRSEHEHRSTRATFAFVAEAGDTEVDLEIAVAPDGVAYRYRVRDDGHVMYHDEDSGFRLPTRAAAWLHRYDFDHEAVGKHHAAILADGEFTSPGLFDTGDTYVLLAEAGVDGEYAASRLATEEFDPLYAYRLPATQTRLDLPGTTPWRVAIVGDLATVAESSLVRELIDDVELEDPDWVQPGRVAWSWWSDHDSPAEFETQKQYVDYAANRGWEYVLVDEGWSDEWMPALIEYAAERDVGVVLWAHFAELNRPAERREKLDRWAEWGVAGIKVDFMDDDDQGRHQFYDALMADAAERELLVNFHGSIVPAGMSRRWPHVVSYEGVKGAEHYTFDASLPAEHNATLPFTRNVLGPMDYTPVTFSTEHRQTADGHELALSVVFESGLQHFADAIDEYARRPHAEWFLEQVPAAWDETELLRGHPGTEATIARRRDGDWFVGSVTAGPERTVAVEATFLDEPREAVAIVDARSGVGSDGCDGLERIEVTLDPDDAVELAVAENGGFAIYAPEQEPSGE